MFHGTHDAEEWIPGTYVLEPFLDFGLLERGPQIE